MKNIETYKAIEEAALNAIENEYRRSEVSYDDMLEFDSVFEDLEPVSHASAEAIIDRVFFLHLKCKTYIVGGAIRDKIMGLEPKDIDYCVVGATPDEMLKHGFQQVGAAFPVFLHPVTGDEYALARREKKTGEGYHGFEVEFGPDVTIEEDLGRRDFTMGAMARLVIGDQIIDPFGGQNDIKDNIIRLVNKDAFVEDPLRVIRGLRFAARYPQMYIEGSTLSAMGSVIRHGGLNELPYERFVAELKKTYLEGPADNAVYIQGLDNFWGLIEELQLHIHSEFFSDLLSDSIEGFGYHDIINLDIFEHITREEFFEISMACGVAANMCNASAIIGEDKSLTLWKKHDAGIAKLAQCRAGLMDALLNNIDDEYKGKVEYAQVLLKHRMFSEDMLPFAAMIDKMLLMAGFDEVSHQEITKQWASVKADQFPGLDGKELGQAIAQKRIGIVVDVLSD